MVKGRDSTSVEVLHAYCRRPMAACFRDQDGTYERALLVSHWTAGHSSDEVWNLHPHLPPGTEPHHVAGKGSGVIAGHRGLPDNGHGIGIGPGGAVALKFQQVVHGARLVGERSLVYLVVDLRGDVVVAAHGNSEGLVSLVEYHPPIDECVGVVGQSEGILAALPPLLVTLHKPSCKSMGQ